MGIVLAGLAGALYGFAPSFGLNEYPQNVLETVVLAVTLVAGAVAGIIFGINWMSKRLSGHPRSVVNNLLTGATVLVVGVYIMVQYLGVKELDVYEVILRAAPPVILVVIGSMLGVKFATRYGTFSISDIASASKDIRHAVSVTDAALSKGLYGTACATMALVIAVMVFTPPDSPKYLVPEYDLFVASATIMGLAAFGSAFSTLRPRKYLATGIAFTLIPIIVVQIVFMLSLLGYVHFQAGWWIGVTGVLLILLVLVMAINNIKPTGMYDGTDFPGRPYA